MIIKWCISPSGQIAISNLREYIQHETKKKKKKNWNWKNGTHLGAATCIGNCRTQRCRNMPSHNWTPTMPNMKKTKKHSSKTLPSIGNVSSKSITSIRIPFCSCWMLDDKISFSHRLSFHYKFFFLTRSCCVVLSLHQMIFFYHDGATRCSKYTSINEKRREKMKLFGLKGAVKVIFSKKKKKEQNHCVWHQIDESANEWKKAWKITIGWTSK